MLDSIDPDRRAGTWSPPSICSVSAGFSSAELSLRVVHPATVASHAGHQLLRHVFDASLFVDRFLGEDYPRRDILQETSA